MLKNVLLLYLAPILLACLGGAVIYFLRYRHALPEKRRQGRRWIILATSLLLTAIIFNITCLVWRDLRGGSAGARGPYDIAIGYSDLNSLGPHTELRYRLKIDRPSRVRLLVTSDPDTQLELFAKDERLGSDNGSGKGQKPSLTCELPAGTYRVSLSATLDAIKQDRAAGQTNLTVEGLGPATVTSPRCAGTSGLR